MSNRSASYCASDDDAVVEQGLQTFKRILADNYVRPDEAEKVKSLIRERGSYKIIDKSVGETEPEKRLFTKAQRFPNLGIKDAPGWPLADVVRRQRRNSTDGAWYLVHD
ncbi:anti-phage BREX system Lon protease BrxL [Escherichia coli]|uniref:anti-phage BREX system Lon protease BrxL n=1 Tax=Escherichia coli TaxID=562 RepID=UPI002FCD2A93